MGDNSSKYNGLIPLLINWPIPPPNCSAPTVMMPLGFEPTLAEPAAVRCYCMKPLITTESGLVPAANGEPAPVISVIAPVFGLML